MIKGFNNCETSFLNHLNKNGLIQKVKRYERAQFTASLKKASIQTGELQSTNYIFSKI